ncbi:hypothetical protein BCR36DRAFT_359454 [Piromyces finnis]|uniref:ubiquitinyl hydrolase 1 n=1 Tax=Piromyces finnis TaxID=1754191 RepID=A0A1Y1V0S9_9FUNG|nr:hypothetical protein BCR36DRAFT_359454 [Piromyces finnis]|eukprot:ORX44705.1 hypothetical protein BCR36DRAFT_359454 [Piromyces finnis]
MKIPEIIVSPPSPVPFPQVSTSHDHLFKCNGSCGFSQHFSPATGINNVPLLDLENVPAVCEHEYDDIDVLILESVFNTRNDYIRPIDSVYMNRINENIKREELLLSDEDDCVITEIRSRDVLLDDLSTNSNNNNSINHSDDITTNKDSNSNKLQNYKVYFTKNKQSKNEPSYQTESDIENERCCWITSTLQVVCNLPGVETDFPRYNCMLNDAQRELYKLLQIIQSDDNTLNEIIKLNENDPKLLAFLNSNSVNQHTVNPASLIKTLFSSIQDPFIDYFSGIVQDIQKTSSGSLIVENMTRCNYSSEFTRVLLDKILVGTRLRSRCQATIICRDMCSICHKKSQKSVMKYCRFFPLLLSKEIKAKNKYEISFIDIMREELNHLPVFQVDLNKNDSSDSLNVESRLNNNTMKTCEIPSITLNNNDINLSRTQNQSNDGDEIILSDYVFPTIFSNQKTDFNCDCKSCIDQDGIHRHIVRLTSFVHLPEILVFSIVRDGNYTMEMSFNPIRRERCMKRSLNRPIRIPMELDMGAHVHPEYINESTSTFYKLHGFVTQKDGRYIAYTHIANNYQWYKIDDSKIIPIDLLVGSFPTEGVSLLFYVLQFKKHY